VGTPLQEVLMMSNTQERFSPIKEVQLAISFPSDRRIIGKLSHLHGKMKISDRNCSFKIETSDISEAIVKARKVAELLKNELNRSERL
jgi:hypothetical protein